MNLNRKFDILQKVFHGSHVNDLVGSIIYEIDNGYELFGEFQITKKNNRYIVTKFGSALSEEFFNLKNAIVWVTMYKRNKIVESNRVKNLDIMFEGAEVSYQVHKKLHEKAKDLDSKSLYFAKLQEDSVKKQAIGEELDKYIMNAKTWQYRQFKQAAK